MSSIESREVRGTLVHRVRYRHQGRNLAVTFATPERAEQWRALLDAHGHDVARQAIVDTPPDLSEFGKDIVPRPGQRVDPFGCFVYMLWGSDRQRPLYIGATTNLPKRIWDHVRERPGVWSTYSVIRCKDEAVMWRLESKMIAHYRPELNVMGGRSVA